VPRIRDIRSLRSFGESVSIKSFLTQVNLNVSEFYSITTCFKNWSKASSMDEAQRNPGHTLFKHCDPSKRTLKSLANAHTSNHYMGIKNAHLEHIMQENFYDTQASKKSTNLSINSDLLQQAKNHRINLSKALEQRLVEMLLEEKRRE